jgi:hypothetical protein
MPSRALPIVFSAVAIILNPLGSDRTLAYRHFLVACEILEDR